MSDLLVSELIASGYQAAIAISGGGSSAVASLLKVSGASRFVVEASVPYHADALRRMWMQNRFNCVVLVWRANGAWHMIERYVGRDVNGSVGVCGSTTSGGSRGSDQASFGGFARKRYYRLVSCQRWLAKIKSSVGFELLAMCVHAWSWLMDGFICL